MIDYDWLINPKVYDMQREALLYYYKMGMAKVTYFLDKLTESHVMYKYRSWAHVEKKAIAWDEQDEKTPPSTPDKAPEPSIATSSGA